MLPLRALSVVGANFHGRFLSFGDFSMEPFSGTTLLTKSGSYSATTKKTADANHFVEFEPPCSTKTVEVEDG